MSFPQNQEENTITSTEETGRLLTGSSEQPQIKVLNVYLHQHIDKQVVQIDQRQNTTEVVNQPEQTNVPSGDQEDPSKAFDKLKKTTGELYDRKFDVDVGRFDIPASNLPEIHPELLSIDFYEGRFIPNDDQYDPKTRQIKFKESDKKVSIDELISRIKSQSFISIVGYPGAGKTTLSRRLARRLDETRGFLVLRIPFMSMNDYDDEKLTLKEFLLGDINFDLNLKEKTYVFKWIKNHMQNCFVVFDGFDQVNWNLMDKVKRSNYDTLLTCQELVSNLCRGTFLPNCHIIFTSRPHAMLTIPKQCRPKETYFVGDLTSENMKILVDALVNDEQKSSEILNKLSVETPHLESTCYNPLMLQLYLRASLSSSHETVNISTMTQIFQRVLGNLRTSKHTIALTDEIVLKLSRIAYNATKNGTVVITTEDLRQEHLSTKNVQDIVMALFASNKNCGLFEGNQQLYFSHQTFQEFFSALYMVHQMPLDNFTSFVQTNLLVDHWSVVVQFLSGLLLDSCMNEDLSSSAINQFPSDASTSSLTSLRHQSPFQSPPLSSQIASTSSGHAINQQQPSIEFTLLQTSSQQAPSLQPLSGSLRSTTIHSPSEESDVSTLQPPYQQTRLSSPGSLSSTTIQSPPEESDVSTLQPPSQQTRLSSPDEKLRKREVFLSDLYKKTQEVAANHNDDRSIIAISRILREGNDEDVTVAAGSHFDGGRIWMRSSDTQNDFHAVTSFLKSMPGRIGELGLGGCEINSNQFRPWKEAIKSMSGSIVQMELQWNLLSVHDVIEVMSKVEELVEMGSCLDGGDGGGRDANMMERSMLKEALDRSDNKKLEIQVDDDVITHKDRDD